MHYAVSGFLRRFAQVPPPMTLSLIQMGLGTPSLPKMVCLAMHAIHTHCMQTYFIYLHM